MKTKRLEVKEGNISVPIYEFSDGRYRVDTLLGEKRKRLTRTLLDAAKIESRRLIAQIASGRAHEEPMTLAEVEDYRLAKGKLVPFRVSLLSAVEEWIAGRGKTSCIITKTVAEVAEEFLTSKRVEGVGFFHLEDRKYRMNKFAASFPGRVDQISAQEIEVGLNGLAVSACTRNNYRNAILQLFRYGSLVGIPSFPPLLKNKS